MVSVNRDRRALAALILSLGSTTEIVLVISASSCDEDDVGAGDLHGAALFAADDGVGNQRCRAFPMCFGISSGRVSS